MALDAEQELKNVWWEWIIHAKSCHDESDGSGAWTESFFADARNAAEGRNSIMDAEALLCLLLPQGAVPSFNLRGGFESRGPGVDTINAQYARRPDSELKTEAAHLICAVARDFLEHNSDDGRPVFSAKGYVTPGEACPDELRDGSIDIVDSFTMSVSTCLQILQLLGPNGWGNARSTNEALANECDSICDLAHRRLTAALIGLCNSFAYAEVERQNWEDATGIRWPSDDDTIDRIQSRLDVLGLDVNPKKAFECGWSWGVHRKAQALPTSLVSSPTIETEVDPAGAIADPHPYLYFTLNALEGIPDLFEPWVRTEELLTPNELALAARLENLSDLTSRYWGALAFAESTVSKGNWAIEAMPWRTADGSVSLQWSLYVYSIALNEHRAGRRATRKVDVERLIGVIDELAQRGRMNRPLVENDVPARVLEQLSSDDREAITRDSALSLHTPGITLGLYDHEGSRTFDFLIYDYAPQLLKRAAILLSETPELDLRDRLRSLIDAVWDGHLNLRSSERDTPNFHKHWDYPLNAYGDQVQPDIPNKSRSASEPQSGRVMSWYLTERIVEGLVAMSRADATRHRRSDSTINAFVQELSEHLTYDLEEEIRKAGSEDRSRLEHLRSEVSKVREESLSSSVSSVLRNLLEVVDTLDG